MRVLPACCAVLVVLAGCSLPAIGPGAPEDPNDRLGYEAGYTADASLSVTTDDGLNESEREAVLGRTMARVEELRGLEFERTVEVELISREEYRSGGSSTPAPAERAFVNARWEALFGVGEDADATASFEQVYGSSVIGFYSNDRIVIVSDSETPQLDSRTLAHELLHALQDQHLGFGPRRTTFDGSRAREGLVEGDANYVETLYEQRCGTEWDCLAVPERPESPGSFNRAIYGAIIQPYVEGPRFVRTIHDRGGWEAVNDAYERFPESTEQTIHPERYPDEPVAEVTVEDRSAAAWERIERDRQTDRLGEVAVYTMFQTNDLLEDHERYNYSHPASTGWAGDRLVPYTNAETGGAGYVWRLTWDSPSEAREFADAYRELLRSKNATSEGGDVFVIPTGPYADAFRVTVDGDTVTVVNAPTREELDAVYSHN
ncbi:Hvo_1808 family surface protein [Halomarina oriensis]|uniref:DUF4157 domain-containing protein n=1 Tax=Halomarina oriensis TaxID=671145 RepID=A0A6B0GJF8_9EURY|nr:Hvo_1808 family surface protein [Halomarina oriensis]MWG34972.1 hypothetical protein [Halomarina oriensis]